MWVNLIVSFIKLFNYTLYNTDAEKIASKWNEQIWEHAQEPLPVIFDLNIFSVSSICVHLMSQFVK